MMLKFGKTPILSPIRKGGETIDLQEVTARYVKILGIKRATQWGYSVWEIKVFNKNNEKEQLNPLSKVHYIRLRLESNDGKKITDNFYWRGTEYLNYKALNQLPEAKLVSKTKTREEGGKLYIDLTLKNPKNSLGMAFAIRTILLDKATGVQITPVFFDDNYFTLFPGESKKITLGVDLLLIPESGYELKVLPYN